MTQRSKPPRSRHIRPGAKIAGPRRAASTSSPINHVVIIVKEDHTCDNYFGTFPGANGVALARATDPQLPDPAHDHHAWLHRNDASPHGALRLQYVKGDIPAYWAFAQQYTLCDQWRRWDAPTPLRRLRSRGAAASNDARMSRSVPWTQQCRAFLVSHTTNSITGAGFTLLTSFAYEIRDAAAIRRPAGRQMRIDRR
jgi:hypothetical protein